MNIQRMYIAVNEYANCNNEMMIAHLHIGAQDEGSTCIAFFFSSIHKKNPCSF